jgi:DNA-3-methyladenine glycosylase I
MKNPIYVKYHDEEWGVPVHDDRKLFEFIVLESAQAGLSWETVLNKRAHYREAFAQFDYEAVARFGEADVARLLENAGLIRNRLKIMGAINNAQRFIEVVEQFGTFDQYIWGFVNGERIVNTWDRHQDIPASTPLSDQISKDMKQRGFKFFGTTICYAHLQATGVINDHLLGCFRHGEV